MTRQDKSSPLAKSAFLRFHPREYLKEYYSEIGSENSSLLEFFAKAYKDMTKDSIMLEFGGGPTIYPLISAAPKVKEIYFSDYLDANLEEVKLWKTCSDNAFNWRSFIRKAMSIEGSARITKKQEEERASMIRQKIVDFIKCNAFKKDPMGPKYRGRFDIVNVNFVAESITSSIEVWERVVSNICTLLKENGTLIMTALKEAQYYTIQGKTFPAASVKEENLLSVLKKVGFQEADFIHLNSIPAEVTVEGLKGYHGYKGIIFLKAKK